MGVKTSKRFLPASSQIDSLAILERKKHTNMLTEADARELEAALKTTEGREQIAQTMYEPFKKGRDYVAIGRQC